MTLPPCVGGALRALATDHDRGCPQTSPHSGGVSSVSSVPTVSSTTKSLTPTEPCWDLDQSLENVPGCSTARVTCPVVKSAVDAHRDQPAAA